MGAQITRCCSSQEAQESKRGAGLSLSALSITATLVNHWRLGASCSAALPPSPKNTSILRDLFTVNGCLLEKIHFTLSVHVHSRNLRNLPCIWGFIQGVVWHVPGKCSKILYRKIGDSKMDSVLC